MSHEILVLSRRALSYTVFIFYFFRILPRSRDTGSRRQRDSARARGFFYFYVYISFISEQNTIVIYEKRVNLTNTAIRVQTTTTTATKQYTTEPCSTRYFDPWGFKRNRAVGSDGPNIIMRIPSGTSIGR